MIYWMSEIEGINSIGKSVSVSFRVRVVRASGQAGRSGVGACGASASNAGGLIAKMCAGPVVPGARLLRRHNGFKRFLTKLCCTQRF